MACTTHYYQVRDTVRIYLQNISVVSLRMNHIPVYNTSTQFVQDNSSKTIILFMYNNLVLRWLYRTRTLYNTSMLKWLHGTSVLYSTSVLRWSQGTCTLYNKSVLMWLYGTRSSVEHISTCIKVVIRTTFICTTHQCKGCYTEHVHLQNTLV